MEENKFHWIKRERHKKGSIELYNKVSENMKGEKNHFYGKKHTEESRKLMSNKGPNHPKYGKTNSAEQRQKNSEAMKVVWARKKKEGYSHKKPEYKEIIPVTDEIVKQIEDQYYYLNDFIVDPNNQICYIYVLFDPISLRIRYIGKTRDVKQRINDHLTDYKYNCSRKNNWIVHNLKQNLVPIMKVIETCNSDNWQEREIYWISYALSKKKYDLLNDTGGGDGMNNPPPEVRAKLSECHKGKHIHTEEYKKYMSEINSGSNHPQYGKPKSEETRNKISETLKNSPLHPTRGKHHSEEHKAKISAARINNPKCSNASKQSWNDPNSRELRIKKINEAFQKRKEFMKVNNLKTLKEYKEFVK
jgi:group I intron endonuclease